MARKEKLTRRIVESIEPGPADVVVWDTSVTGFHVKVTPAGKRVYFAYYRTKTGQQRRPKIGEHGVITCDQARDEAKKLIGTAAVGGDPSGIRLAERHAPTLADLWERVSASSGWKPRYAESNEQLWRLFLAPSFGEARLKSISRGEIAEWMQKSKEKPINANRALSLLRLMLNRAKDWGMLDGENPASRIKRFPENSREVFLSPDQLGKIMAAIDEEERLGALPRAKNTLGEAEKGVRGGKGLKAEHSRGISAECAALFRLLIFTGARLGEIRTAKWEYLDVDAECLRLPDSKTGKKTVWLNSLAMAEIERIRELAAGPWIIPGPNPAKCLDNPHKAWGRVRKLAGIPHVRLHDLRHSFASFAVAAGLPLFLVGKALGHAKVSTTERYAHLADDPVKNASETVADAIRVMLGGS